MTEARDRDIGDFDRRAGTYEDGWKGQLHRDIATRTADLALGVCGRPRRVLDVGCGTGLVLRTLAAQLPNAERLIGIDPAPTMVSTARARAVGTDDRLHFDLGMAEELPYEDASFDLVVTVTSFHHWQDQAAGVSQCARVLAPDGRLVLTDLVSLGLLPTLIVGRRDRARTRRHVESLLRDAGLSSSDWHRTYAVIIASVVATR